MQRRSAAAPACLPPSGTKIYTAYCCCDIMFRIRQMAPLTQLMPAPSSHPMLYAGVTRADGECLTRMGAMNAGTLLRRRSMGRRLGAARAPLRRRCDIAPIWALWSTQGPRRVSSDAPCEGFSAHPAISHQTLQPPPTRCGGRRRRRNRGGGGGTEEEGGGGGNEDGARRERRGDRRRRKEEQGRRKEKEEERMRD